MSTLTHNALLPRPAAEPAWDIARLFPYQGQWSFDDYVHLSGNRLVEFTDGFIEVLPMPTELHQAMVAYLYGLLLSFVTPRGLGKVLFAPLRIKLPGNKFREPDLVFMLARNSDRRHNEYWDGADLVMEVVSEDGRARDVETKRTEYAQAGIPEYWIVDPERREITVLQLAGDRYEEHGIFRAGEKATSILLAGFELAVNDAFDVR